MSFLANDPEMQALLSVPGEATEPVRVEVLPARTGNDSMIAGGAYDSASKIDRELALWQPPINSADGDILPVKETLDARTRDRLRNDAYVAGGSNIHKDSIVGSMFVLNAKPEWRVLGLDQTWAEEFQVEVEAKFTLWAESLNAWPDAARRNTLTEIVRLAVGIYLSSGEFLASVEWLREADRHFNTAIQVIDLDRLSTPPTKVENRFLRGGVEMNAHGAATGYYVRKSHPNDYDVFSKPEAYEWKYVPARKPWGRLQMIHIFEQMRADQTRGISEMVAALKEIKMTKNFRSIMLQNAVVNATYAASIESELPTEAVYQALGGGNLSADQVAQTIAAFTGGYLDSISAYTGARGHRIDGVKVPHLFPGTKLQLRPAGQGGPLGTEFEASLLRYLAANLGVSYEELAKDFSKTNYSSAKAAMAQTERFMASRKKIVADRLASIIYMLWLEEAISKGEITSMSKKAPNFWEGLNREAYSACEWIGASKGQIDELKETQAAVLRLKYGLSTRESELMRLGKDWRRVFAQLEREKKEADRLGLVFTEDDNMMNAATGAPREKEAKGEKDDGSEDNTDA